jgi:hypothetical protein
MKDIIRMQQLAGIITEGQARKMMQVLNEEDTLKQDVLDFWDTLLDDAAQSDGEYEAEWDTEFFIEQYPEYKERKAEVEKVVKILKKEGTLTPSEFFDSTYDRPKTSPKKSQPEGEKGTGSVTDFVKQNLDAVWKAITPLSDYNSSWMKKQLQIIKNNPDEYIKGNSDVVQILHTEPDKVYNNGDKMPWYTMGFDIDKINPTIWEQRIVVNGTNLYIEKV